MPGPVYHWPIPLEDYASTRLLRCAVLTPRKAVVRPEPRGAAAVRTRSVFLQALWRLTNTSDTRSYFP